MLIKVFSIEIRHFHCIITLTRILWKRCDDMLRRCYPGGKTKAFNITYDDGILQDVRFVALLNKYGIKGTFNLNSALRYGAAGPYHRYALAL